MILRFAINSSSSPSLSSAESISFIWYERRSSLRALSALSPPSCLSLRRHSRFSEIKIESAFFMSAARSPHSPSMTESWFASLKRAKCSLWPYTSTRCCETVFNIPAVTVFPFILMFPLPSALYFLVIMISPSLSISSSSSAFTAADCGATVNSPRT